MILGALIDIGLPLDGLRSALGSLAIEYGEVTAERVTRAGVTATKFRLIEREAEGSTGGAHEHRQPQGLLPGGKPARPSRAGQGRGGPPLAAAGGAGGGGA